MLVTIVAAGVAFQSIAANPRMISGTAKAVLLVSAVVYIFGFAVSWGPIVWLVCSEIFPLEGREVGMTITTMVNWTFAGLVMGNALSFMKAHGNASIFYVFGGFCVIDRTKLVFSRVSVLRPHQPISQKWVAAEEVSRAMALPLEARICRER